MVSCPLVVDTVRLLELDDRLALDLLVDKRIVELYYVGVLYFLHDLHFVQYRLDMLLFVDVPDFHFFESNLSGC